MIKLAANLSMMFNEVPFLERFSAAAACGFKGVEFLFPYEYTSREVAAALDDVKLTQALFNLSPGNWAAGERGMAAIPGREREFAESIDVALEYAGALRCPRLHVMAGLLPADASVEDCERVYESNLRLAASRFAQRRVEAVIEPINHRDIPSYFLNTTRQALAVIERVGAPNLKLQLDLYHCSDYGRRSRPSRARSCRTVHARSDCGKSGSERAGFRRGQLRVRSRAARRVRLRRLGGLRVSPEERDARRAWMGPAVWNHRMKTRVAILSDFQRPRPYAKSRPLSIEEIELEEPSYGEALVRIESAGVCHSDLSTIDGILTKPLPIVLGHEAAGIVEKIGPGVTTVQPGDKVVFSFVPTCGKCTPCSIGRPALCEPGNKANAAADLLRGTRRYKRNGEMIGHHLGVSGFAEYTVAAEESLVKIPNDVPGEIAAVFGCAALTGLGAVIHTAHVVPGSSVAIFGGGGVGLMTLLGALLVTAHPVIVVDPVEKKRKKALEMGADAVVDPAEGDVAKQIQKITGSDGAQFVFEVSGTTKGFEQAVQSTSRGGMMVAIGIPRGSEQAADLAGAARLR